MCASGHPPRHAAAGPRQRGRFRRNGCRTVRRPDPDPRRGGRSAGGHRGSGMFRTGNDEIDLWHGLFRASEHRGRAGRLGKPASDDHRLSAGRSAGLCAGGVDFHRGGRGAMAARRAGPDPGSRRDAGIGRARRPRAGRDHRSGLHRAGRTLLERRMSRRGLRPHPWHGARRNGAGSAGKRGVPDP